MNGKGLSYGLNITKKQPSDLRPSGKRKFVFDDDYSSAEDNSEREASIEAIEEVGYLGAFQPNDLAKSASKTHAASKQRHSTGDKKKPRTDLYGDLSTSFTSKKHAAIAEEVDPNIYDYDSVYDSLKLKTKTSVEDEERKPKYMNNLLAAAAVRKRDATIAEEKKLAREREAEGDEFADKEKFVTSAYKKQQEEARRLEEEERLREAEELKQNKGAGMTKFFKNVLEKGEQRHSEAIRAAEERAKAGPQGGEAEAEKVKTEAELAREINERTGITIAVNDEGQVVDKRQLLKGGLNILPKPRASASTSAVGGGSTVPNRSQGSAFARSSAGKDSLRERQSRLLEAQLEQATKKVREQEEEERLRIEEAVRSRKTKGEIMSAKERYLARKMEAKVSRKIE